MSLAPVPEKMTVTVQVEDRTFQNQADNSYSDLERTEKTESSFNFKNVAILTSFVMFTLTGFVIILSRSSKST